MEINLYPQIILDLGLDLRAREFSHFSDEKYDGAQFALLRK
jgi:hypothetical protein